MRGTPGTVPAPTQPCQRETVTFPRKIFPFRGNCPTWEHCKNNPNVVSLGILSGKNDPNDGIFIIKNAPNDDFFENFVPRKVPNVRNLEKLSQRIQQMLRFGIFLTKNPAKIRNLGFFSPKIPSVWNFYPQIPSKC